MHLFKKGKERYFAQKQMKEYLEKLMAEYNLRQWQQQREEQYRKEAEAQQHQREMEERAEQERTRLIIKEFPNFLRFQVDTTNDLFTKSDKIFLSFRFHYKDESYRSYIVFTGRTYDENGIQQSSEELLVQTPHIPLIGGCWSNHVAMNMLAGQQLVSYLLENTYWWLKYELAYSIYHRRNIYAAETEKKDTRIIKIDRCLYAPVLYLLDKNDERKYMSFLSEKYPEAYEKVLQYPSMSAYLENYHDADVESVFEEKN